MNKFMGGLTLGIIATTCFFIFYRPFEKKVEMNESPGISAPVTDTLAFNAPAMIDTAAVPARLPANTTDRVNRDSLVIFAKLLIGTPYLYGSTDPAKGFDCSGFITHVFNHFSLTVPRSSYEFGPLGIKRSLTTCQRGDLILFTGTNPLERNIGHMGIVCDFTNGYPSFIHSSSGKANGVTITSMENKFYQERLMDVIDILSVQ
jgi:cell wall-associated NlpC family hydrolase